MYSPETCYGTRGLFSDEMPLFCFSKNVEEAEVFYASAFVGVVVSAVLSPLLIRFPCSRVVCNALWYFDTVAADSRVKTAPTPLSRRGTRGPRLKIDSCWNPQIEGDQAFKKMKTACPEQRCRSHGLASSGRGCVSLPGCGGSGTWRRISSGPVGGCDQRRWPRREEPWHRLVVRSGR